MSFRSRVLTVAAVALLALGPAIAMPRLSAHQPTLAAPTDQAPHGPLGSPFAPMAPLAGMAIKVKDAAAAAAKFKTRAGAASGDYGTGVASAANDWEANSLSAEGNYKASVTEAASQGRYGKGVRGSAGKYRDNATKLGPQRYQTGIANAEQPYAQAMGPVLATISALTLPPRQPKGMNQERSNIVATALRKMKVGA